MDEDVIERELVEEIINNIDFVLGFVGFEEIIIEENLLEFLMVGSLL